MPENLHGLNLRTVVNGLDSESRPWRPPIPQEVKDRVIDFIEWIYPFHLFPSELEADYIPIGASERVDIVIKFHFPSRVCTNHVLFRFSPNSIYVQVEENSQIGIFQFTPQKNFKDLAMIVLNVRSRSTG